MPLKKGQVFVGLCVAGAVTIGGYIYHAKNRTAEPAPAPAPDTSLPVPGPAPESPVASAPAPTEDTSSASSEVPPSAATPGSNVAHVAPTPPVPSVPLMPAHRVYYRYNGVDQGYGRVGYIDVSQPANQHIINALKCEVVYVAGGSGICLSAKRGVVTTYSAQLFDEKSLEVRAQLPLNGVPSRSRVSSDGKLAAFTVFVTGHGYTSLDFSTQTLLLDATTGAVVADVETFAVTRDGKPFKEPDFNFWGVTFTPDAREFYATLSSGGKHFLVRANIEARTAEVIHSNVECPSLSPDGTRIAYKKRFMVDNRIVWELHVLDLSTGKETPLSEKRSVDDQLEWLDSAHVLYSAPETADDSSASTNVWMAAADGKSKPKLFLRKAYSPAAVR